MKIKSYIDFINEELQRVVSDQSASGRTKSIDTIWDDPSSANSTREECKGIMKINEAIEDSDLEDIRDIFSDLNDDYGLETLVVKVNTKDTIMIKTDGMLKKDNFFNTIENLTKDLNNVYKRLNYFSREIDISNFDIRDYIFDGDGEPLTLKDKFYFYMIIYLYV